jgi:hypothetical protein
MTRPATCACPASASAGFCPVKNMMGSALAPPSAVLHRLQQSPLFHTASRTICNDSVSWKLLCQHSAGPGQRLQARQGEHLDLVLYSCILLFPILKTLAEDETSLQLITNQLHPYIHSHPGYPATTSLQLDQSHAQL